MQFKDMRVAGMIVTAEGQQKAYQRFIEIIQKEGPKSMNHLETLLARQIGVPWATAHRAADRILQKARKANQLVFRKGAWHIHMNQERT